MRYLIPNQKETGMFSFGLCFSTNKDLLLKFVTKLFQRLLGMEDGMKKVLLFQCLKT